MKSLADNSEVMSYHCSAETFYFYLFFEASPTVFNIHIWKGLFSTGKYVHFQKPCAVMMVAIGARDTKGHRSKAKQDLERSRL
jgi:hypothetical protein